MNFRLRLLFFVIQIVRIMKWNKIVIQSDYRVRKNEQREETKDTSNQFYFKCSSQNNNEARKEKKYQFCNY